MHIESALRGVKEEDRCSNWKKGSWHPCGVKKEGAAASSGGFLSAFGFGK
jgi:hypothetical protein